jgi:hypothetical protein
MGMACLRESGYLTCLPRCNIRSTFQMAFVWNVLYGSQWFYFALFEKASLELGVCIVALVMTLTSYAGILGADQLQRVSAFGKSTVNRLMNTIGVLVGLAWEKAFHIALVTVSASALESGGTVTASLVHDSDTATLLFTVVLCVIVLPAWWWYLLPAYLSIAGVVDSTSSAGSELEDIEEEWTHPDDYGFEDGEIDHF